MKRAPPLPSESEGQAVARRYNLHVLLALVTSCKLIFVPIHRESEWFAFQRKQFGVASFKKEGTIWINAADAKLQGRPVPFFLVKDYAQSLKLQARAFYSATVIESLIETKDYVPIPTDDPLLVVIGKKKKKIDAKLTQRVDDDVPGVTHRVMHWQLDEPTTLPKCPTETESWTSTPVGRMKQDALLQTFKAEAALFFNRVSINNGQTALFLPLLNNANQFPQTVVDNWIELAQEFEHHAPQLLRDTNLLQPDFVRWTDIIENKGGSGVIPKSFIGEGFSALRPEVFVKSGFSVTLEHMEHLASTSINLYPKQQVGNLYPKFRSQSLWRGWLMEDIKVAMNKHLKQSPDTPFNRQHLHRYYIDHYFNNDFDMMRFFVETLHIPTYYVIQEEGDAVITTHFGAHDVICVGGPSYQVSWNFGFSLSVASSLLESFKSGKLMSENMGNDCSTTAWVFRRFLWSFWPGKEQFEQWYPTHAKSAAKVCLINIIKL